mmetsp:Transcript_37570/g.86797  ORF Transcript_37570/g.86797 Transcript_37570/m.86797 type:complete len:202 (+) Transcript_37570:242-847(+)
MEGAGVVTRTIPEFNPTARITPAAATQSTDSSPQRGASQICRAVTRPNPGTGRLTDVKTGRVLLESPSWANEAGCQHSCRTEAELMLVSEATTTASPPQAVKAALRTCPTSAGRIAIALSEVSSPSSPPSGSVNEATDRLTLWMSLSCKTYASFWMKPNPRIGASSRLEWMGTSARFQSTAPESAKSSELEVRIATFDTNP